MEVQQKELFKGPRISRITIGRLHNLGNYEHVRYEVSVELPLGSAPASVLSELDELMANLDPASPVAEWDLRRALAILAKSNDFTDDQKEWAAEMMRRHDAWKAVRDEAIKKFDQFGGTSVYTDAKQNWDDDQ